MPIPRDEIVFFIAAIVIYRVFLSTRLVFSTFCASKGGRQGKRIWVGVRLLIEIFLFYGYCDLFIYFFWREEIYFSNGEFRYEVLERRIFSFFFFKYRKGINWRGLDKWRWNSNWIGLDFCNIVERYQLFVLKSIDISWTLI